MSEYLFRGYKYWMLEYDIRLENNLAMDIELYYKKRWIYGN